ncbi:MAG: tetratricopeptide repeat protein [Ignavibacteriota bacterium]
MTLRLHPLLLAALLSASWIAPAQTANAAFRKGAELFQRADYPAALREFEQAARAEPTNAAIENALGLTETKLNHIAEANSHYQKSIQLDRKSADPHRNLGINYLAAKHYDAAEKEFRQAIAIEPGNPFSHYYLALAFLDAGNDEEAAAQSEPARALLSDDPDAAFRMAEACLRIGRTKEGLAFVGTLEKQSALTAVQEFDLATLLNSKGLYSEAVARLRRVVALDPTLWVNRYNLADALLEAGENQEAAALLESLAAEKPHSAPVLSLLGTAYQNAGKPERALDSYRQAVAADPTNHDYYLDYARMLADLNRYDESEKFIESSLRQFGDDYALTIRLGALQMMQGKLEEARQTFQKAIDANPGTALGHVALAQTYLRERRDADAARELADARAHLPPDANVEHYYGLALVRLERYEEAIAPLQHAIQLNPGDPETYFMLGKADAALDRTAAARADFEQAIHLDPRNTGAYYQLSRIYTQLGEDVKAREMAERTRQLIRSQREEGLKAQRARLGELERVKQP